MKLSIRSVVRSAGRDLALTGLLLLFLTVQATSISSGKSSPADPAWGAVGVYNAKLKYELDWSFGGKPQRGWYLYEPLISRLIGTDSASESVVFAERLSRWQRSTGLPATGVLNRETWAKMVSVFQAQRIKSSTVAPSKNLFQAPSTDFLDHLRPSELRFVERRAYTAYKQMIAAATADPDLQPALRGDDRLSTGSDLLKIISAYRSPSYQAELRKQGSKSGRAGLAVRSPHFTGRALDLYVGGEPVNTDDQNRAAQINTPIYRWLVNNAGRFGFFPYFYEPWHWEFRADDQPARLTARRHSRRVVHAR